MFSLGPYTLLKNDLDDAFFLSILEQVALSINDAYMLKELGDPSIDKVSALLLSSVTFSSVIVS